MISPQLQRIRRQLTLFVPPAQSGLIERLREEHNPVQHSLIKAHVTLCREDEILDWEIVRNNIETTNLSSINLVFSTLFRFDEGKGVYLKSDGNTGPFDDLRKAVLQGAVSPIRKQEPHATLMHPRNSTCTDEIVVHLQALQLPLKFTFSQISLIEQTGGDPWKTLQEFSLIS